MFIKRFATAVLLLPLLVLVIVYGEVAGTALLVALVAALGMHEYLLLGGHARNRAETFLLCLFAALVVLSFAGKLSALPGAILAVGVVSYALFEAAKGNGGTESLRKIAHVASGLLLVPFFMGHAVLLRKSGHEPLLFIIVLVMVGDTAAYLAGTLLGRHKLAPAISPKKSVEGSIGGVVGTVASAMIVSPWLGFRFTYAEAALIAVAVNLAAQAGDLAESFLKRAAGVKDSGSLLPGHGGILDRVDSFLPTLPLFAAILAMSGG